MVSDRGSPAGHSRRHDGACSHKESGRVRPPQEWLAIAMPTASQSSRALSAIIVCGVVLFLTGAVGVVVAVIGSVTYLIVTTSLTALCGIAIVAVGTYGRRKARRDGR
jgi:hypothetical protein